MSEAQTTRLQKELRLPHVVALATGATLSAGLFLLPGIASQVAGPAIVLCYIIAAIPLVPATLCAVELATAMPRAGGAYYFIDRSLGPLAGGGHGPGKGGEGVGAVRSRGRGLAGSVLEEDRRVGVPAPVEQCLPHLGDEAPCFGPGITSRPPLVSATKPLIASENVVSNGSGVGSIITMASKSRSSSTVDGMCSRDSLPSWG